jgi:putative membrane protein
MEYHYLWLEVIMLVHLIVNWLLSALALWIVAQIIPGIKVSGFGAAMIATLVIALVDVTIGPIFRFLAWPITFLTLGLFSLVINACLLKLAAIFTPGFQVHGFLWAIVGSVVLTILSSILRGLAFYPALAGTAL